MITSWVFNTFLVETPSKRSTSKNLCLFCYVVCGDSLAQCYLFVLQYLSLYSQRLGYLPAKFEKLVSDCTFNLLNEWELVSKTCSGCKERENAFNWFLIYLCSVLKVTLRGNAHSVRRGRTCLEQLPKFSSNLLTCELVSCVLYLQICF